MPLLKGCNMLGRRIVPARHGILAQVRRLATEAPKTTAPPPGHVEVFVDDKQVFVPANSAIIQACEKAGVEIPRFCYHERLAVAGNCRMCLVEVERMPKPAASCAMPVTPGMRVRTDTPMVKKAREGVMEFLLANHPLDCPICDQGGECDLQDQAVRYGSDRSRLSEIVGKRAVQNKNFGPLVKTTMTRCIHCTRCVRFANEVAGAPELGTSGRGNGMEIGTYVAQMLDSEMSGNIVDLCPVGALTSKPYAFVARPWELKRTDSVDVLDALGSNIRVDSRSGQVLRILPRLNEGINEEWLNDKARHACDGLRRQRLTTPLVRGEDGALAPATWAEALGRVADALRGAPADSLLAVAGQHADAESMVALKDLWNRLGSENVTHELFEAAAAPAADLRPYYTLNSTIAGVEAADALLLVGTNPRHEAPSLNTRIRKAYLNGLNVGLVGELPRLNYDVAHLGATADALDAFVAAVAGSGANAKPDFFAGQFRAARRPMILVSAATLARPDGARIQRALAKLAESVRGRLVADDYCGYNVLPHTASHVAALDIGFVRGPFASEKAPKVVYLLGADTVEPARLPKNAFVVYQGHHGDAGAHLADVVLPGAAYTEKDATFVNAEGRAQRTRAAVSPPAGARIDWQIVRALSQVVEKALPYDTVDELRERMAEVSPTLRCEGASGSVQSSSFIDLALFRHPAHLSVPAAKKAAAEPLRLPIRDFYLTDPISRASATMAQCSAAFTKGSVYAADPEIQASLSADQPC